MNQTERLYDIYLKHPVVSIDSRNVPPGSVFFGIKGPLFNGNDFAAEAINKGAVCAVVDATAGPDIDKFFRVENTLETLQSLARFHRKNLHLQLLAITGTNGKTTTKELCNAILGRKYSVLSTSGNLNNHIGVPLTLLSLKQENEIGIIEMGANHPGEIARLCEIAMPDYGLITNIGMAHLEGFISIEGVRKAKGELFEYLMNNKKTIFLNEKDKLVYSLVPKGYEPCVTYNGKTCYGELISGDPFLNARIKTIENDFILETNLIGKYNLENVVASVAVGAYFGISAEMISEAVKAYYPNNYRSQLVETTRNKIIMDAYNANPSSMRQSIDNFLELRGDNKTLIIGQMLELGNESAVEHKKITDYLQKRQIKDVFLIGNAFKAYSKVPYKIYDTVDEFIKLINPSKFTSRLILIKGSRGNSLEKLLPFL